MTAQPICFMIMPYGTKPTPTDDESRAPKTVNFDRLWDLALRPMIEALGYDAVRADQDVGSLIITEMIERLAISDLVIADLSIPNGNVYYEVGIRHAARAQGCVLIAATWAQRLFDVEQMRTVRYPLTTSDIDGDAAAAIRDCLAPKIANLTAGLSPFYQVLPDFPNAIDLKRSTAFRTALQELSELQSAISAARTSAAKDRHQRALDLAAQYTGRPIQSAVALDLLYLLRDCTDWATTLAFIDGLPPAIRELPVVTEQRALAQSQSTDVPTAIGALQELNRRNGATSERLGLLGGIYKRLAAAHTDPDPEAERQQKGAYLNEAISAYDAGMHQDLNDYYPSSNLARLYRTRMRRGDDERAKVAAAVAMTACERARRRAADDPWLKPTLLGAAFDAGDAAAAQGLADEIEVEGPVPWKLQSTLNDCRRALAFHTGETARGLAEILAQLEAVVARFSLPTVRGESPVAQSENVTQKITN